MVFGWRYAVYGGKHSSDAASVTDSSGHATDALLTCTYLDLEMHILTLRIASRHVPKAGAVCGSSARTDLCGGRQVTAVPTATITPSTGQHGSTNGLLYLQHTSGVRAAAIQSLLATAQLNGIEPYAWLKDTLEKLPAWPYSRIDELLPL